MVPSSIPIPAWSSYQRFFDQLDWLCSCSVPRTEPFMHETVFQQLLLDTTQIERPVDFRRFRRLLYQAMVHFRRMKAGDLTGGFTELQLLRVNLPALSTSLRQLSETMLTPMIAYYYFRVGDYPTASYYNQQSVAISSELQHVYPVLHLHQIQQQFNLSRIEFAQHQHLDALRSIKELIDYLIIGRPPLLTGTWTTALRLGLDTILVSAQLLDILNELVFIALQRTDLENLITSKVLVDVGQSLSQQSLVTPSSRSAMLIWWQSSQYQAGGQLTFFLSNVATLIERYPVEYDQLKLLLLGRLHCMAAQSDLASPSQLRLIRRFVNTKLQLSHRLQQYIRTIRRQESTGLKLAA